MITVPDSSGKTKVRSAVSGAILNVISLPSPGTPSNFSGSSPAMVPATEIVSAAESPTVIEPVNTDEPETEIEPTDTSAVVVISLEPALMLAAMTTSASCTVRTSTPAEFCSDRAPLLAGANAHPVTYVQAATLSQAVDVSKSVPVTAAQAAASAATDTRAVSTQVPRAATSQVAWVVAAAHVAATAPVHSPLA